MNESRECSVTTRALVDASDLFFPPTPIPRPGDRVVWYQESLRIGGVLVGHSPWAKPIVRDDFDGFAVVDSYDKLRRENPRVEGGPNWNRMPPSAAILRPTEEELRALQVLLDQRTPPGPKYLELVTEIWARGHEIYVVGGTVRDVIARKETKDVDLATTMPLDHLFPLVQSMYRRPKKLEWEARVNGHLRLGGALGTDDPFIDLCVFKHSKPGTDQAVFADDFARDMAHRDFACNSIYFDPITSVLIDPSGYGVVDAESCRLRMVCNHSMRSPFHLGQIIIRFFKFRCRGFSPISECTEKVSTCIESSLQAMSIVQRISYTRTQILSKYAKEEHTGRLDQFREEIISFGAEQIWDRYFAPHREEILNGN